MVNSAVANLPSRPTKASSDSKANYGRLEPSRPQAFVLVEVTAGITEAS
jgi:hypothetical protein